MELPSKGKAINDVTCNYQNLVFMATEIYLQRFAVDGIQTLYLEQMSLEQHQYLVLLLICSHNMSYPVIWLVPPTYTSSEFTFLQCYATLSRQVAVKSEVQSPKLVSKFPFN